MKNLIVLFLLYGFVCFGQTGVLKGKVVDSETLHPLFNANIVLQSNLQFGTATDYKGEFTLEDNFSNDDILVVSYVGYETKEIEINSIDDKESFTIYLFPKVIPSQSVLVKGSIGTTGITPLAFDKITRTDIEENYTVQDIPQYLSTLPSTTFYSEGGNGIGYNYISIRGFDQRRISVSINGIPQNEPEDHNVYWLDFPDLLASTEMVQVQRGAGSGVFGYPAIGGSINIITSAFSNKPHVSASASLGSYNTRKYSASFSSGLVDDKYSVYAKLSQILSSGYRNMSWVKFNSYHLSAIRYDENFTTQINLYGGPIEDGLAYTGLPKFAVKDKELRRANYSYWEADNNEITYSLNRRPSEIENFSQPHYELLNELQLNNDITINSALFLILGTGFFDYDGSWSVFSDDYFRLNQNGFDPAFEPTNALIRAQVENAQYGWIPRVSIKHNNGDLILGGEFRKHKSDHWGRIQYAENLPPGVTPDYYYYFYNGSKDIISGFVHESYRVTDRLNLLGELQLTYHKYRLFNERYAGNEFEVSDLFFNPRFGINYKLTSNQNIYFSFARVTREPRLKNYYDAAESSGGEVPQFEQNTDGSYDFDSPLVQPETMNDFELGTSLTYRNYSVSLNLFYMLFDDEIVKNGELDRFGQPITGNVDRTIHSGIELSANARVLNSFEVFANATYSWNRINKGYFYLDSENFIDLSDNRISGFPDFLANFGLNYKSRGVFVQLTGKYVGSFYSDNYDDKLGEYLTQFPGFVTYSDNKNEAYFTADFSAGYELNLFNSLTSSRLILQVNNIFDNLYSAYAIGQEFFPAAERNFLVGVQLGL
ncbi:MAG: TonB-dependent receptor [Ignavibacteriaceae bacterium]